MGMDTEASLDEVMSFVQREATPGRLFVFVALLLRLLMLILGERCLQLLEGSRRPAVMS
jgi:hypothetical protein